MNNAYDSCSIYLDGCQLTRITNIKFLGMTLDGYLTWKPHIDIKMVVMLVMFWNYQFLEYGQVSFCGEVFAVKVSFCTAK